MVKLVDLARALRTFVYWMLGPIDRAINLAQGRRRLPPLWLRRHVGRPSKFLSAARDTAELIDRLGVLRPHHRVLDIGCGCGAMVAELSRRLGDGGRYVGFDVHRPSIVWCRRHRAFDTRFEFHVANARSPYTSAREEDQDSRYVFPLADAAADFVLAKSVFTHLLPRDLEHFLSEIRRVLSAGGVALVSCFSFDPELACPPAAFPFAVGRHELARCRYRARPHAAIAYSKGYLLQRIDAAGLRLREFVPGFWPGTAEHPEGQDQLLLSLK